MDSNDVVGGGGGGVDEGGSRRMNTIFFLVGKIRTYNREHYTNDMTLVR